MSRSLKVIFAVVLVVVGSVGCVVFLTGQGLDRAAQWVSISATVVSVAISAGGLLLGWLTWRQSPTPGPPHPAGRSVTAAGTGAVALGGDNAGGISTDVSAPAPPTTASPGGGVSAAGAGSVAVGGNSTAAIGTKVTNPGPGTGTGP